MVRKLFWFLLCLIALAPGAAFAGSILSPALEAGTATPAGQSFAFISDHDVFEPDWGLPGLSLGPPTSDGAAINSLQSFAGSVAMDGGALPLAQSGSCANPDPGFCAEIYWSPRTAIRIGDNTVVLSSASGDYLTEGDLSAANNSFAGENPSRANLSSDVVTVVPEPGSLLLLTTGILGIAGIFRVRRS